MCGAALPSAREARSQLRVHGREFRDQGLLAGLVQHSGRIERDAAVKGDVHLHDRAAPRGGGFDIAGENPHRLRDDLVHRRLQRRVVLHGGVRPTGHQHIDRAVGEREADIARGVFLRCLRLRDARRQPQIGLRRDSVEQRLAMDKMVVERAVRDADLLGHLAQAEAFMAVLRHEASGGLQRFGPEIAVAIGRPARLCAHAPLLTKLSRRTLPAPTHAEARRVTRSSPYWGVMSSSMTCRISLITAPRARALVAAWAAMLSPLSASAVSSAAFSNWSAGTRRSKNPAVTASAGPNISAVITTRLK